MRDALEKIRRMLTRLTSSLHRSSTIRPTRSILKSRILPKSTMGQQNIMSFFSLKNDGKATESLKRRRQESDEEPVKIQRTGQSLLKEIPQKEPESSASEVSNDETAKKDDDGASKGAIVEEASKLVKLAEKEHVHKDLGKGDKFPYSKITKMLEKIEHESSRLQMTAQVSNFFLEALEKYGLPDKLVTIVYLFINRLGPDYEPDLELGLGEFILIKAISSCYGRALAQIKKDYDATGDLGLVAQKSRSGQPPMFKPPPLDIDSVFENLTKIAKTTGKDSQGKKINIINKMLAACDLNSFEAKFLIRSLEGKLRIGLAEKTVIVALAQAFLNYESKGKRVSPNTLADAENIMKEAFSRIPNYEVIIRKSFEHGVMNLLDHCSLTPGIPLKPMLAKPTKSVGEVLDRFQGEDFTCEYKYDGERAQVHLLEDGTVRIYSRNSEDMSQRYPDLIAITKDFIKKTDDNLTSDTPKSLILDCEAVAWDREAKKILLFQTLSTRKRKDVSEADIKVHICLFAFDLLYHNGVSLITKSLSERRQVLFDNFQTIEGKFQFANHVNSSNTDELQAYLEQSVKDSCEGLMVKMLHGPESYYEPSKRSRNWLKLKKDYLDGVGDSLDLVVVGAYRGRGKRTGGYGGFLLACYNDDTGEYETACKIGTGFSEEVLASLSTKLKSTEIEKPKAYYTYDTTTSSALPDVWFEPTTVFEVLVADLQLSPVYKAAHSEYGKGISMRFPRLLRVRDDKGVEDATTSTQVAEFYESQANVN